MRRVLCLAAAGAVLAVFTLTAQAAGNAALGKTESQVCQTCHGPTGNSTGAAYPKLAGEPEDYLVHALEAYKDGDRKNAIMQSMAGTLTQAEMWNIAAYFSEQQGLHYIPILK